MPWMEMDVPGQREIVVALAQNPDVNVTELTQRLGVSRKTIYKWKARAGQHSDSLDVHWSRDHSRRPKSCPWQSGPQTEQLVVDLRQEHPCWGPRKLRKLMEARSAERVPSVSTIAAILKRRSLIDREQTLCHKAYTRFERSEPNALWQMDFKGAFAVGSGRCHPLTVVDDHSRYGLGVKALGGESGQETRPALIEIFRTYGLPECMLLDNGSCWGRVESLYTAFTAWLLRLGIRVIYARPYHPQTKGKNERFNRTLKAEAISGRYYSTLAQWQKQFDDFLRTYNTIRPHEALGLAVPASRYLVSSRAFPEHLEPIEYLADDVIRKVGPAGYLSLNKQRFQVGRAFTGEAVAIRPTRIDGVHEVYYCYQRIAVIDQRDGSYEQT